MNREYVEKTKQKLPEMTKGLKKVGEYLLAEPIVFAIHPAKKVGSMIDVSETMVIRFCHYIGYRGYSELQKEVRHHLMNLERVNDKENVLTRDNNFKNFIDDDVKNLKQMKNIIDAEVFNNVVEKILESEKVVVAGYYHSFSFAHWFSFNLNYIVGNASLFRPESDAGILELMPEKSCIIIFSFFRYAVDTIRLAEEAKKKGVPVIVITDSWASPAAEYADFVISIYSSEHSNVLLQKGPITMSIMNSILSELIDQVQNRGKIQPTFKYYIKDGENE
ncbi:MurR/RpiR family transcriptional regulator [Oceanobacillus sp. 1P07AA]|uniref:MurR/RpiR family transcriptional regulator n=1 Tax=Oceanobacillus sp. 1P07AA TaxID=3132293 RepID=UPI0039A43FD7